LVGRRGSTWSISVPTACMIFIHPLARAKASSLSFDPLAHPSKLENGCSIIILRLYLAARAFIPFPAEQRFSQSFSDISLLWYFEAKDWRSGKPSSIPWKPALEMALSLSSKLSSGVPTETVAKEVGIESKEDRERDILGDLAIRHNL
jgi:hypothetical protein